MAPPGRPSAEQDKLLGPGSLGGTPVENPALGPVRIFERGVRCRAFAQEEGRRGEHPGSFGPTGGGKLVKATFPRGVTVRSPFPVDLPRYIGAALEVSVAQRTSEGKP